MTDSVTQYGIGVPRGANAKTAEEAEAVAKEIGTSHRGHLENDVTQTDTIYRN
jgi:succinyl-CoA synthetase beta subunit